MIVEAEKKLSRLPKSLEESLAAADSKRIKGDVGRKGGGGESGVVETEGWEGHCVAHQEGEGGGVRECAEIIHGIKGGVGGERDPRGENKWVTYLIPPTVTNTKCTNSVWGGGG